MRNDELVIFFGLIWYTAIIAELAYRNGRRNGRIEVKNEQ